MAHKIIEFEYIIRSSPRLLYSRLSTPYGLAQWFADDVTADGGVFTFFWDKQAERAKISSSKINESIRFQWIDDSDDDRFFEFRIKVDDLTSEVALIITENLEEDEIEESSLLWDSQVGKLMRILGS